MFATATGDLKNDIEKTPEYFSWIGELKKRYRATQIKAAVSVNTALLEFYWSLGKDISERYTASKLGNQFYIMLSEDLKIALPDAKGLSPSSLKYSGYFYRLYSRLASGQQVVDLMPESSQQVADFGNPASCAKQVVSRNEPSTLSIADLLVRVPWGHHMLIIDKCGGDVAKAFFYVRKTVENGWSRNVLAIEIEGDLYSRQGKAVTNFVLTMPELDSDLAQQLTKDPLHLRGSGVGGEIPRDGTHRGDV